MLKIKLKGPITKPCVTPWSNSAQELNMLLISSFCFLLDRSFKTIKSTYFAASNS